MALMASGFLITSFNVIGQTLVVLFNTHPLAITLANLLFSFAFVPGNFVVVKCLDKFGLRFCVSYPYHSYSSYLAVA